MARQKTFKLVRATLALDAVNGKQRVITLPANAIVVMSVGSAEPSGLVSVRSDGRSLRMFAVDLSARGLEIIEPVEDSGDSEMLPATINFGEWTG